MTSVFIAKNTEVIDMTYYCMLGTVLYTKADPILMKTPPRESVNDV